MSFLKIIMHIKSGCKYVRSWTCIAIFILQFYRSMVCRAVAKEGGKSTLEDGNLQTALERISLFVQYLPTATDAFHLVIYFNALKHDSPQDVSLLKLVGSLSLQHLSKMRVTGLFEVTLPRVLFVTAILSHESKVRYALVFIQFSGGC